MTFTLFFYDPGMYDRIVLVSTISWQINLSIHTCDPYCDFYHPHKLHVMVIAPILGQARLSGKLDIMQCQVWQKKLSQQNIFNALSSTYMYKYALMFITESPCPSARNQNEARWLARYSSSSRLHGLTSNLAYMIRILYTICSSLYAFIMENSNPRVDRFYWGLFTILNSYDFHIKALCVTSKLLWSDPLEWHHGQPRCEKAYELMSATRVIKGTTSHNLWCQAQVFDEIAMNKGECLWKTPHTSCLFCCDRGWTGNTDGICHDAYIFWSGDEV